MKLNKPVNSNYCFTIVKVGEDITLKGRDKIVHKNIFGNMVITMKNQYPSGTLMIYIPAETQLSEDYCKYNNLYDKSDMNENVTEKGYIGFKKRRIKAIKLGGFESNGMLMPLSSLSWLDAGYPEADWNEGDEFDELVINGKLSVILCNKYVPAPSRNTGTNPQKGKQPKKISKLVDNQFRFHVDTSQLGKNIHNINPDDIVSITYKLHGTSGISSKVLIKRNLKWYERLLLKLGVRIETTHYDNEGIYASRKVVKNESLVKQTSDYYGDSDDWRKIVHNQIFTLLSNGMTAYYEIVGFTPNGTAIQKDYDYGCEPNEMAIYIYRLTYTNDKGNVFEFSAKQVQDWCKSNGVNAVPELYYGRIGYNLFRLPEQSIEDWRTNLLEQLKTRYWHKQCTMCKSKVPSEGIVLRKEGLGLEVYKYKNFDFLQFETKQLDNNETNIEDDA